MTLYRVYVVNSDGHTAAPPHLIEAAHDEDAAYQARQYIDGQAVEVWLEAKRVMRIDPAH